MNDYRLYILNNDGRFVGVRELTADNDAAAVAAAKAQPEDVSMELWQQGRLVETFGAAHQPVG